jgi:hypothetical protein
MEYRAQWEDGRDMGEVRYFCKREESIGYLGKIVRVADSSGQFQKPFCEKKRICKCGTVLNIYNREKICSSCERKKRKKEDKKRKRIPQKRQGMQVALDSG